MTDAPKYAAAGFGFLFLLLIANYQSVVWFGFPFLYCWGYPLLASFYGPWLEYVKIFTICCFGYKVYMQHYRGAIGAGAIVIFLYGFPKFADTLFRLGGSCG